MTVKVRTMYASCQTPGTLTLLTYPHAEAAATYPLLFFQQLLQKA